MAIIIVLVTTIAASVIERCIDLKFKKLENNVHTVVETKIETSVKEVMDSADLFYAHKVNKAIEKYPEIDIKIENLLTDCLNRLGAGKAMVGIYHNGDKTIERNPFLKFTCTNEAISEKKIKVRRSADLYQGSSYARIAYYALEMNKHGYLVIDSVLQLKPISIPDYLAAENLFVKSIAFVLLLKTDNSPLGFIAFYSYDDYVDFSKNIEYLKMVSGLVCYEIMLKYDEN